MEVTAVSEMDEFGLIQHLQKRLPEAVERVRVGIGDDAAVLETAAGEDMLITTDTMVESVHFLPTTMGWSDIGYKLLVSSISDIAAMGGIARHAVLSLAIPKGQPVEQLEAIYDGVAEACRTFRCAVVGGDIVSTGGPLVLTSTVTGTVPAGTALLRSGAKVGDVVFVTGTVGGSGAGLSLLLGSSGVPGEEAATLCEFHQRPVPQVVAGPILREVGASSCNDISDGLGSELNEIAGASGIRLRIAEERIPIAAAVRNFARRRGESATDYALYGGEDYQLVGTASSFAFARALARCESVGVRITQIGRVEAGDGVVLEKKDGQLDLIQPRGYNHFRD